MPIDAYNGLFGGSPGAAMKAYRSMVGRYGREKGREVFYATVNDREKGRTGALSRAMRRRGRGSGREHS